MYELNDIVEMRKGHPCGANAWKIVRMGADMKVVCQGCQRQVTLTRHDFDKRLKRVLEKANED
ncbi:hypothetical protein WVI01_11210 [Weissella viridescens]|uniref:Bacterial protein of uncharacterized function (DUF951) n=1 Tax=Weissella viridescens TaxID=1629 RepID=A0A0R2H093_WEIVI|nr:DUF951 domain-containing protein [Weissella viridescens]KRN46336.1 hypothetical protein IV50_GL000605 [Weissella viridescens]GEA95198.1 hypothetical protein WVI01_11210 [Weissella viridescens]SUP52427.1 Bacterial protein of uncharacterised function (DUF951) [Weissella viridescens]